MLCAEGSEQVCAKHFANDTQHLHFVQLLPEQRGRDCERSPRVNLANTRVESRRFDLEIGHGDPECKQAPAGHKRQKTEKGEGVSAKLRFGKGSLRNLWSLAPPDRSGSTEAQIPYQENLVRQSFRVEECGVVNLCSFWCWRPPENLFSVEVYS